jgi:hypothetical protein
MGWRRIKPGPAVDVTSQHVESALRDCGEFRYEARRLMRECRRRTADPLELLAPVLRAGAGIEFIWRNK